MINSLTEFFSDFYNIVIKKRQLPLRVRKFLDKHKYEPEFNQSLQAYISSGDRLSNASAECEIHIVTSKADSLMAVCAAKSLILSGLKASVVIHADPSFEKTDEAPFEQAFESFRVIYAQDKERMPEKIKSLRSKIPDLFLQHQMSIGKVSSAGSRNAWAMKLFDFHYFAKAPKIIILDSDTLFFREPKSIIEWRNEGGNCLYAQPHYDNLRLSPSDVFQLLKINKVITKFNSGLLAIDTSVLTLKMITEMVEVILEEPKIKVYGDECIWRLLFSDVKALPLSVEAYPLVATKNKYLEIVKDNSKYCYLHFLLKYRYGFYSRHLRELTVANK